jgi:hypothetical protein
MGYLYYRFGYENRESADFWISEQRDRQEELNLVMEIKRVRRATKAHFRDRPKQALFDYQLGEWSISTSFDVPFGVEYTFLPPNIQQDFQSDSWYLLGWEECTPEDKTFVTYFKRTADDKARTTTLFAGLND